MFVYTNVELNRLSGGGFGFVQMLDYLGIFYQSTTKMEKNVSEI
jgi:hypothetical protein